MTTLEPTETFQQQLRKKGFKYLSSTRTGSKVAALTRLFTAAGLTSLKSVSTFLGTKNVLETKDLCFVLQKMYLNII